MDDERVLWDALTAEYGVMAAELIEDLDGEGDS